MTSIDTHRAKAFHSALTPRHADGAAHLVPLPALYAPARKSGPLARAPLLPRPELPMCQGSAGSTLDVDVRRAQVHAYAAEPFRAQVRDVHSVITRDVTREEKFRAQFAPMCPPEKISPQQWLPNRLPGDACWRRAQRLRCAERDSLKEAAYHLASILIAVPELILMPLLYARNGWYDHARAKANLPLGALLKPRSAGAVREDMAVRALRTLTQTLDATDVVVGLGTGKIIAATFAADLCAAQTALERLRAAQAATDDVRVAGSYKIKAAIAVAQEAVRQARDDVGRWDRIRQATAG